MKRGEMKQIRVAGQTIDATYLGKGHYSTAYQVGDMVYLFTCGDNMKEMLLHCQGANLPQITYIETIPNRDPYKDDIAVYGMPFYRNITAADQDAWSQYRLLKKLWDVATEDVRSGHPYHEPSCYYAYQVNERLADLLGENGADPELIASISSVNSWAANYGAGVTWEWGARNIGVDQDGRIIFRDCLFDSEKIYNEVMDKRARYGRR